MNRPLFYRSIPTNAMRRCIPMTLSSQSRPRAKHPVRLRVFSVPTQSQPKPSVPHSSPKSKIACSIESRGKAATDQNSRIAGLLAKPSSRPAFRSDATSGFSSRETPYTRRALDYPPQSVSFERQDSKHCEKRFSPTVPSSAWLPAARCQMGLKTSRANAKPPAPPGAASRTL